jgi:hypothetical protein
MREARLAREYREATAEARRLIEQAKGRGRVALWTIGAGVIGVLGGVAGAVKVLAG